VRGNAQGGTGVGWFVIKGIGFRFNGALGFGRGTQAAFLHAPSVRVDRGRCVQARTLRQEHRHRGGAGAGEGRRGEGVVSGAGGVYAFPKGREGAVAAGGDHGGGDR